MWGITENITAIPGDADSAIVKVKTVRNPSVPHNRIYILLFEKMLHGTDR